MEELYNKYLEEAMFHYYSKKDFEKCYDRVPKQRNYTFKKCLEYLEHKNFLNILELGTSRSFVDGKYPGACNPSPSFWEPNRLEKWDWSSGLFTKYFSDVLNERDKKIFLTTIDISPTSIHISKIITQNNNKNIQYLTKSSEEVICSCSKNSIDFLYLDTGNLDETTALLHLREAQLIVKNDILKDDGLILIDDVRNPYMILNNITTDKLGKSKYALPYLLENGYEIVEDEYQVLLKKI